MDYKLASFIILVEFTFWISIFFSLIRLLFFIYQKKVYWWDLLLIIPFTFVILESLNRFELVDWRNWTFTVKFMLFILYFSWISLILYLLILLIRSFEK